MDGGAAIPASRQGLVRQVLEIFLSAGASRLAPALFG
jgi:hypothetical protein